MYQSIDDDIEDELDSTGTRASLSLWVIGALAIAAVFAAVYLTSPGQPATIGETQQEDAQAQSAYRKALGETNPALRRARLEDFLRVHPAHSRRQAAEAQLDIINYHDSRAWNDVTRIIYDAKVEKLDKMAALEGYNGKWGGSLLGGRSDEIEALRDEIGGMEDPETKPDRRLKEGKSPIPTNIQDSDLLGAPRQVIIRQPPPPPTRSFEPEVETLDVIMPTVRRNVTPRYPRKAFRRKINAVVTLRLDIGTDGRVKETELVSADAERYEKDFIKAAERAAMKTRYNPKKVNGVPVLAKGIVKRYRFAADSN